MVQPCTATTTVDGGLGWQQMRIEGEHVGYTGASHVEPRNGMFTLKYMPRL